MGDRGHRAGHEVVDAEAFQRCRDDPEEFERLHATSSARPPGGPARRSCRDSRSGGFPRSSARPTATSVGDEGRSAGVLARRTSAITSITSGLCRAEASRSQDPRNSTPACGVIRASRLRHGRETGTQSPKRMASALIASMAGSLSPHRPAAMPETPIQTPQGLTRIRRTSRARGAPVSGGSSERSATRSGPVRYSPPAAVTGHAAQRRSPEAASRKPRCRLRRDDCSAPSQKRSQLGSVVIIHGVRVVDESVVPAYLVGRRCQEFDSRGAAVVDGVVVDGVS